MSDSKAVYMHVSCMDRVPEKKHHGSNINNNNTLIVLCAVLSTSKNVKISQQMAAMSKIKVASFFLGHGVCVKCHPLT